MYKNLNYPKNKFLYHSRKTGKSKITYLPFYGGAKEMTLQITESSDGKVTTQILNVPYKQITKGKLPEKSPSEVENPPLPSKHEHPFDDSLKNVHSFARKILQLQESAKEGKLSRDEEFEYHESIDKLGESADELSRFQEGAFGGDEEDSSEERSTGLSEWFDNKRKIKKEKENKKKKKEPEDEDDEDEIKTKKEKERERQKEREKEYERLKEEEREKEEKEREKEEQEEKEKKEKEKEEKKKEENKKETSKDDDETVAVSGPPDEASVAEAKPVGLAIAGNILPFLFHFF